MGDTSVGKYKYALFNKRVVFAIFGLSLAAVGIGMLAPTTTYANASQHGQPQLTLNPGGGVQTNGSDGLRFTVNRDNTGYDRVFYRNTEQYCCTAGAPMLNVGGTLFGQAGPAASSSSSWTSLSVTSTSGATASGTMTSSTGNASATIRYTATKNSMTYIMDRTLTYTYPNDYITDSYTFTIPSGNTDAVKFYLGGDTAPGSSDSGYGIMLTSPVRSVISLNTSSQIMFGFREVSGSKLFDGATSQSYNAPYATVRSGGDIGYVVTAATHDAGLMVQWNLGSTPGTQTAQLEQFATQQGTNLNASLAATTAAIGSPVTLNISIANTVLSTVSSIGYTVTLPSGLVLGSGSQSNTCGGILTANAGGNTVVISGASVAGGANCVVSVPVLSSVAGTYTISAASASSLSAVTNNIGSSSLTVTNDTDNDGITNASEEAAPNSGDANDDGTSDASQSNVTAITNAVSGEYSVLEADSSCSITSTQIKQASQVGTDSSYSYPLGLFDFTANCGTPGFTTTIKQYFYDPPARSFVLRKYANGAYQTISGATIATQTIAGRQVLVVSYQVTDGGALDDDGTANGIIVDPAGPAVLGASMVTTSGAASPAAPSTGVARASIVLPATGLAAGLALLISQGLIRRGSTLRRHKTTA